MQSISTTIHAKDTSKSPQFQDQNNSSHAGGNSTTSAPAQKQPAPDHEIYSMQQAIHLLIILCLATLGSFSLAPYLLQQSSHKNTSIPSHQYKDGTCTAQPQTIHYLQHSTSNQTVPITWTKAGKNSKQFALAQACAAAFTITYESIDANHPASFTNVVDMLSSTGKKSFFESSATKPEDLHSNALWQAQARKEHLQQSVQLIKKAQLQVVQISHGTFLAIFTIKYRLITKISGKSTNQPEQLTIVLAKISTTPPKASTGWLVVDWRKNAP